MEDLRASRKSFSAGKPRCVDVNAREVLYLSTDARSESGSGGMGAVLYNGQGCVFSWFGQALSAEECEGLNVLDFEQIIIELEALAVLASLSLLCANTF